MHTLLARHIRRGTVAKFPSSRITTLPAEDRAALALTGHVKVYDWGVLLGDGDAWVREVAWKVYGPKVSLDELVDLSDHRLAGVREKALEELWRRVQLGIPGPNLVTALAMSHSPEGRAFAVALVPLMQFPGVPVVATVEISGDRDLDF